jgi:hypothetical protein
MSNQEIIEEIQSTANELASPVKGKPPEYWQIVTAELSRDLEALKEIRAKLRIGGDRDGVRIVSEWICKKKEVIDHFNLENYGGDV